MYYETRNAYTTFGSVLNSEHSTKSSGEYRIDVFDVHEFVHRDIIMKVTNTMQLIHLVVCLTTGPKTLPKKALHIVRSRAFSFK
jgi:hypothetical protein